MLWEARQSPLGGAHSTTDMAPGNVRGTYWWRRVFGMHTSLGWKNDCISSGPEMDLTMHWCLCFPMNLMCCVICTLLPCNQVGLVGSNSNCRGRGQPHMQRYLVWCATGASCSICSQLGALVGPTITVETCCQLWQGCWWNAPWKFDWRAQRHWHGGCVVQPRVSHTALRISWWLLLPDCPLSLDICCILTSTGCIVADRQQKWYCHWILQLAGPK